VEKREGAGPRAWGVGWVVPTRLFGGGFPNGKKGVGSPSCQESKSHGRTWGGGGRPEGEPLKGKNRPDTKKGGENFGCVSFDWGKL